MNIKNPIRALIFLILLISLLFLANTTSSYYGEMKFILFALAGLAGLAFILKFFSPEIRYVDKNKSIKVYKSMITRAKQKNTQIRFVLLPQKTLCTNNQINKYINEISGETKMDILDFTLKLCNLKLFAIQGNHLNSDGYEKLSKMIKSYFETNQ